MQRIGTAISSRCRKGRCSGQEYLYNQCERRRWYDYRSAEKAPQMQCIQRIRRAGQHSSSTNRSVTRLRPEERLCNHRILKPSIFQSQTTTWNVFFVICFFLCCSFIHIAAAKVDTLTVYSQAMKKDVNSLVILPDRYPEAERFPAIYLLHGYSDAWNSGWLRYCDGLGLATSSCSSWSRLSN